MGLSPGQAEDILNNLKQQHRVFRDSRSSQRLSEIAEIEGTVVSAKRIRLPDKPEMLYIALRSGDTLYKLQGMRGERELPQQGDNLLCKVRGKRILSYETATEYAR